MGTNKSDIMLYFILSVIIVLFFAMAFYANVLRPFFEAKQYVKSEIRRACTESERRYWQRKLKKLYITHIPIIGKTLVKFMDN